MKEVKLTPCVDSDVRLADEAWDGDGARQLRIVRYEARAYMDVRDFNWVVDNWAAVVVRMRFERFWTNVAIAAAFDIVESCCDCLQQRLHYRGEYE